MQSVIAKHPSRWRAGFECGQQVVWGLSGGASFTPLLVYVSNTRIDKSIYASQIWQLHHKLTYTSLCARIGPTADNIQTQAKYVDNENDAPVETLMQSEGEKVNPTRGTEVEVFLAEWYQPVQHAVLGWKSTIRMILQAVQQVLYSQLFKIASCSDSLFSWAIGLCWNCEKQIILSLANSANRVDWHPEVWKSPNRSLICKLSIDSYPKQHQYSLYTPHRGTVTIFKIVVLELLSVEAAQS